MWVLHHGAFKMKSGILENFGRVIILKCTRTFALYCSVLVLLHYLYMMSNMCKLCCIPPRSENTMTHENFKGVNERLNQSFKSIFKVVSCTYIESNTHFIRHKIATNWLQAWLSLCEEIPVRNFSIGTFLTKQSGILYKKGRTKNIAHAGRIIFFTCINIYYFHLIVKT